MQAPTFNELVFGSAFTFVSEDAPEYQGARGPWVKTGARSYRALENGYAHGPTHVVGSWSVLVWHYV